jgi:hypothetical protein
MTALLVGYARLSTHQQDLISQRDGLAALGVDPTRIYVDHGLTSTNRERPGLGEALAACREGSTLVVTQARSVGSVPPGWTGDRRQAHHPPGESHRCRLDLRARGAI